MTFASIERCYNRATEQHGHPVDLLVRVIGEAGTVFTAHDLGRPAGISSELGTVPARPFDDIGLGLFRYDSEATPFQSVVSLRLRSGEQTIGSVLRFQSETVDELDYHALEPIRLNPTEQQGFAAHFDVQGDVQIGRRLQTENTIAQQGRGGDLQPSHCTLSAYARAVGRCSPHEFLLGLDMDNEPIAVRIAPGAVRPGRQEPSPVIVTPNSDSALGSALAAQFIARNKPVVAYHPDAETEAVAACSEQDELTRADSLRGVSEALRSLRMEHGGRNADNSELPILCVLYNPGAVLSDNNHLASLGDTSNVLYACVGGELSETIEESVGSWGALLHSENNELYRLTARSHPSFRIDRRMDWLRLPAMR